MNAKYFTLQLTAQEIRSLWGMISALNGRNQHTTWLTRSGATGREIRGVEKVTAKIHQLLITANRFSEERQEQPR